MGWLDSINAKKKDKVPDIFKDKSEDDILKMMHEAADAKKEAEGLKTKVADQEREVTEIKTEFERVKTALAAAEAKPKPTPTKQNDEELANFVEDPDKAFGQRVAPLTALTIQNAMFTSRMLAQQQLDNSDLASNGKSMDGRLFRAWGTEIDTEAKKYQASQMTSPQAWIGVYLYVKGLHADELADPEVRRKKYNFVEPSAQSTGTKHEDNKDKPAAQQLTEKELHVASKMGVTPENYLKRKQSMEISPV